MMPHLVRWHRAYAPRGLEIVYVDNGQRDALANARRWTREENVPYRVFHDQNATATTAYGVRAYPTAYVLDRSGRVVWEGIPVYGPQDAERAIQQALR